MRHADPKTRAIRSQGLKGAFIALIGIGLMVLLAQGIDSRALDQDPTPLMPGILVCCLGSLIMLIARIRLIFHKPSTLGKSLAKGAITRIFEEL